MKQQLAVLSCDLINSSEYEQELLSGVLSALKSEFDQLKLDFPEANPAFSIYRGDSFQGVMEDPMIALAVALRLKAVVIGYTADKVQSKKLTPLADVRISIGIGSGNYIVESIAESNGEAFRYSGLTLENMKREGIKMALTTSDININEEFRVHLKFLDATLDRWSVASAEVVYYLLKGLKEQQIADILGVSQAAINTRKKAAGWDEIRSLLNRYGTVIKQRNT